MVPWPSRRRIHPSTVAITGKGPALCRDMCKLSRGWIGAALRPAPWLDKMNLTSGRYPPPVTTQPDGEVQRRPKPPPAELPRVPSHPGHR